MNKQHGFSLIEALVALVILSFGLIGVAAMQLKALQSATAGYQRSVATLAAVDAQERIWAALATNNCDYIEKNLKDIEQFQGTGEEPGWNDYWFGVDSKMPTRQFEGDINPIGANENCEFKIEIDLKDGLEPFIYTFRLPKFSEGEL